MNNNEYAVATVIYSLLIVFALVSSGFIAYKPNSECVYSETAKARVCPPVVNSGVDYWKNDNVMLS